MFMVAVVISHMVLQKNGKFQAFVLDLAH